MKMQLAVANGTLDFLVSVFVSKTLVQLVHEAMNELSQGSGLDLHNDRCPWLLILKSVHCSIVQLSDSPTVSSKVPETNRTYTCKSMVCQYTHMDAIFTLMNPYH